VQVLGKKRSKFEMDKNNNENLDWASACAEKSGDASSTNDLSPLKINGLHKIITKPPFSPTMDDLLK